MKKNIFFNRDFLLLSQGQLVNQAGTQIAIIATIFWLKQSTNSASLVGLMNSITALPLLLFSPLGGVIADRWSRRNILIVCDLICGVIACILALLLQSHYSPFAVVLGGLLLGNLILAGTFAFTSPALNALIPNLVSRAQITAAMGFAQTSGFLATMLGQLLGGLLLTHYLPAILYWIDAGTYFVSAAAESMVKVDSPEKSTDPRNSIFDDMKEGFLYVWQRRGMRTLLLATIPLNILTLPVIMLLPFYTTNSLHLSLQNYGYLIAALSIGVPIGYTIGGMLQTFEKKRCSILLGSVLLCSTLIMMLACLEVLWQAMVCLLVLGATFGMVTLLSLSAFIQHTESEKRGRVAAVLVMVTQLTPLMLFLIGMISDMLGNNIRLLYMCSSSLLFILAVAVFSNRDLRDFLSQPTS